MKRTGKLLALVLAGLLLPLLSACSNHSDKPVGSCGSYEIVYGELRYTALTYRSRHPECTEEELRSAVGQELLEQYAILELCAEYLPEQSIDSPEIQDLVDQAIESAKEELGGKDAYKDYLEEHYLTEQLMRRLLAMTQLQIELENKLFAETELESEETLLSWLDNGNYTRVRRVFFPLTDQDGNSMLAQAEHCLTELKKGGAPDALITSAQAAAGAKCLQAEFFFRGLEDAELENAAFSLTETGAVSELVTAADGYYILIRTQDDRDALVNYQLPTLLDRYRADRLDELADEAAKKLSINWNAYGSGLRLTELK